MTPHLALIAALAAAVFAVRLGGFLLAGVRLPAPLEDALRRLPAAVFAALAAVGLAHGGGGADARLLAAVAAGLAAWRWRSPWAAPLVGMAVYWAVGALR